MKVEVYEKNEEALNFYVEGISKDKLGEYFRKTSSFISKESPRISLTRKIKAFAELKAIKKDSEIYREMKTNSYELKKRDLEDLEKLM